MDDVRGVTRRTALRTAAGAGVALAAASGGALPAWARPVLAAGRLKGPGSRPFPRLPEGTETLPAIDHIVVVMMENHSFDNILGTLRGRPGREVDGLRFRRGRALDANPDAQGALVPASHAPTVCQEHGEPSQAWNASHIAYDGGRNDGFVRASGPVAMRYYDGGRPAVHLRAGPALPRRRALLLLVPGPDVSELPLPADGHVERRDPDGQLDVLGARRQRHDLRPLRPATGSPGRTTTTACPAPLVIPGHPAARARRRTSSRACSTSSTTRPRGGCRSSASSTPTTSRSRRRTRRTSSSASASWPRVTNAVLHSPQWRRTALFITYDEHGGYYDHVPPPRAVPPDDIPPAAASRRRARRLRPLRLPRAAHRRLALGPAALRLARRAGPHVDHALHRDEVEPRRHDVPRRQRGGHDRLLRLPAAELPRAAGAPRAGRPGAGPLRAAAPRGSTRRCRPRARSPRGGARRRWWGSWGATLRRPPRRAGGRRARARCHSAAPSRLGGT